MQIVKHTAIFSYSSRWEFCLLGNELPDHSQGVVRFGPRLIVGATRGCWLGRRIHACAGRRGILDWAWGDGSQFARIYEKLRMPVEIERPGETTSEQLLMSYRRS